MIFPILIPHSWWKCRSSPTQLGWGAMNWYCSITSDLYFPAQYQYATASLFSHWKIQVWSFLWDFWIQTHTWTCMQLLEADVHFLLHLSSIGLSCLHSHRITAQFGTSCCSQNLVAQQNLDHSYQGAQSGLPPQVFGFVFLSLGKTKQKPTICKLFNEGQVPI